MHVRGLPSGGRLLLALALAVLLGGCATGHPRASLTSGFGLHSRPTFRRDAAGAGPKKEKWNNITVHHTRPAP